MTVAAVPAGALEGECFRYNPAAWFARGAFLPFVDAMPRKDGSYRYAPSITWLTEDPTETVQLSATAAVFADPAYVAASLDALFATDQGRVNALVRDEVMPAVSDYEPYRQITAALTFSRTNWLDASWKKIDVTLSGTSHWYASDVEDFSSIYHAPLDAGSAGGEAQVIFSAQHSRSVPDRSIFPVTVTGFALSADGYFGLVEPDGYATNLLQGKISAHAPVVPVTLTLSAASADGLFFTPSSTRYEADCVREYAYDETKYYPLFPEYKGTDKADLRSNVLVAGSAEITPFLLEIQKGVPLLPLYANRLSLVTGYRAAMFGLNASGRTSVDSVFARGSFEASAVIGILTNVLLSANVEYAWPLRSGSGFVFFTFGAKIPM